MAAPAGEPAGTLPYSAAAAGERCSTAMCEKPPEKHTRLPSHESVNI